MVEPDDLHWLARAIELSRLCEPSETAFSVGAVLLDASGRQVAGGYSREGGQRRHAEETALRKAAEQGADVAGGTVYSTMEPCGERVSGAVPCAELIRRGRLRRVVYILAEPEFFVVPRGARTLTDAGIVVCTAAELAAEVRAVNAHLLGM